MIEKIHIKNVASYPNDGITIEGFKNINFFFGANGSGKTTISRIIASPQDYQQCRIDWRGGISLQCSVYNRDFVARTFIPDRNMPGIFTLGEDEGNVIQQIDSLNGEIKSLSDSLAEKKLSLYGDSDTLGKKETLTKNDENYREKFWQYKLKYDSSPMSYGLEGTRGNKKTFMEKLLSEHTRTDVALRQKEELEARASRLFAKKPEPASIIQKFESNTLLSLENSPILHKVVIGKKDVDVAALIEKLDCVDWIQEGRSLLNSSDGVCPFCQQPLPHNFSEVLNEYFDETYTNDIREIEFIISRYESETDRLKSWLSDLESKNSVFISRERLSSVCELFAAKIDSNIRILHSKRTNASTPIYLDSLAECFERVNAIIDEANGKINAHNDEIRDIRKQKEILSHEIWRYIDNEATKDILEYLAQKNGLKEDIRVLQNCIDDLSKKRDEKSLVRDELQGKLTSVIPTMNRINEMLFDFGFSGFKLELGTDEYSYCIKREDGSFAQETLSEGEKNFITFLYFYTLLSGNQEHSGEVKDKVVVIDDPVSSLDSDVLYIVSTLIRRLFAPDSADEMGIKQLFVLTHNLYFYKEVSFDKGLPRNIVPEFTYWVVRKRNGCSEIVKHSDNPVKSSYELLWEEIRDPDSCSSVISLRNTMRRILEHYYKFYGDISLNKLHMEFEGDDRILAKSLISWLNDGSHSGFDDFYYAPATDESVERYKEIFKGIFEKMGHIAHYNMMMRIENDSTNENME